MGTCDYLCGLFAQINWWAFAGSVLVAFVVGALWYSVLFVKAWKEVNKIGDNLEISKGNVAATMLFQLISTALTGLAFFVLTKASPALAILVTIAVFIWMSSTLKFKFADWKTFFKAVVVEACYFAAVAVVFILFASI